MKRAGTAAAAAMIVAGSALAAPAAAARDACTLLRPSDLEQAFGEPFGGAQKDPYATARGAGGAAEVSTCRFRASNPAPGGVTLVSLLARFGSSANPAAPSESKASMTAMGYKPGAVAGVGDTALWGRHKAGPFTMSQLNVFAKANTIYLILTIDGGADEASTLQRAKAAARVALAQALR